MSGYLNLDLCLPEKFQDEEKQVMLVLLDAWDNVIHDWVTQIEGLADLRNPEKAPNEYLHYLAGLLGATLLQQDEASEADRRNQLRQVVDWIKTKGTYQSVYIIGLMLGLDFEIMSMYTNDYTVFEPVPWFVALEEGQNPPGLDSLYYNSPHFGVMLRLNRRFTRFGSWSYDYLYLPTWFTDIRTYIEKTRPIHTVPHYYVLLEPECEQDDKAYAKSGDIYTRTYPGWPTTKLYFDDGNKFNDTKYWDQDTESVFSSITTWKIGTGYHKPTYDGLVARWKLNDKAISTVVTEEIADNDGACSVNTIDISVKGAMPESDQYAFEFSSASQHKVTVPSCAALNLGTAGFSVAFRMKTTGFQDQGDAYNMLIATENLSAGSDSPGWAFAIDSSNNMYFMVQRTGYAAYFTDSSAISVADGEWHYVVGTYDGAVIRLYVDDAYQIPYSLPDIDITGANPLYIGGDVNSNRHFNGTIDDVQIYGKVLDDTEKTFLYHEPMLDDSFALLNVQSTGSITNIRFSATTVTWKFNIPAQTLYGICELGLYDVGDNLRIASLFPDINLGGNTDVRVELTLRR